MKSALKDGGRRMLSPLARVMANQGISPDLLTWLGLVASGIAGLLIAEGRFIPAAVALILGGLCDVMDGAVARATGRSSVFGAFLDSSVDRVAEMLFFAGVMVYFIREDTSAFYPVLTFLAAGGSFMVSYLRARAEGLGISCTVGWMERPERLVLLILATLLGAGAMRIALWVLTVLVFWTSVQRMQHVYRGSRS